MNEIKKAIRSDLSEINALLASESLPQVESGDPFDFYCKVVGDENQIVGAIGMEIYGPYGLLRSLVVGTDFRNEGLAENLVASVIDFARKSNVKEIYLLTNTAEKYFAKKGFKCTKRDMVPIDIKKSKEFSSLCPASSIVMKISIYN